MKEFISQARDLQHVLGMTSAKSGEKIAEAAKAICNAANAGRTIFTCGNGGSAADAAHLTEELVGRYKLIRRPLRSVCLNSDAVTMTCIANDLGWEEVFARQLEALSATGDILVAFSTSGTSKNVFRAVRRARTSGITCIHLGGDEPGPIGNSSHIHIAVPSDSTARVQEVHTAILHYFLECIEDCLDHL